MRLRVPVSSTLLFAFTTAFCAATPVEDYFKEKKQVTAEVEEAVAQGPIEDADKLDQAALLKLETSLRALVGPLALKGFPAAGKIALETLEQDEEGSGGMDGLSFTSTDGPARLIVTTPALLEAWLSSNGHDLKRGGGLPAAIASEDFYGGAINNGAAVYKYADLPVTAAKPGDLARAILFKQGQDEVAPAAPDQIGVALVQGQRAYLLWRPTAAPDIAACTRAYQDQPATEDDREGAFEQCYARNLPSQDGYAALAKQAQAIVDELSAAR